MKNTIPKFNREQAVELAEILDASKRQSETLSYYECCGFLFVIACSPKLISPNEWLPVALNLNERKAPNKAAITKTFGLMIGLYNKVNRQVQDADVSLLPGCEFRDDVMANFDDDAPIRQWATGFVIGHDWQKRQITQYTHPDLKDELASQMMVLSFFANREIATSYAEETSSADVTIDSMAADMQGLFVDAMAAHAYLAKTIQQVLSENQSATHQPAQSEKFGRNEPCPCGSGRKYKKCCAAH